MLPAEEISVVLKCSGCIGTFHRKNVGLSWAMRSGPAIAACFTSLPTVRPAGIVFGLLYLCGNGGVRRFAVLGRVLIEPGRDSWGIGAGICCRLSRPPTEISDATRQCHERRYHDQRAGLFLFHSFPSTKDVVNPAALSTCRSTSS